MDQPNVVRALAQCRIGGLRFNLMETSFVIGREKLWAARAERPSGAGAIGSSS
jgi:K+ transporter